MLFTKKSTLTSIILCIAFSLSAFAQSRGGEINGTVTDSSGAVVPGATVTLTNQATNIQTHVNSNSSGYFVFLNVQPGGPAAKAGLEPTTRDQLGRIHLGDIIVAIDGQRVASVNDLYARLRNYKVGDAVTLTVLRDGDEEQVRVTLGAESR